MPTGAVIVVAYNSEDCIEACLTALLPAQSWKIVVVDNASQDRTVERARRFEPRVAILSNSENRGFAAAVNQAIRATDAEICVILNPDVIASADALQTLAHALAPEHVGAVGGNLRDNGSPQKGFLIRRFPTLASAVCEVLLLNRLWPGNPWNRRYRCLDLDYTLPQEVDQPAGACLAIKRKAWDELAGFDENFFPVWFEDVDFCRRLRDRGWKVFYCPEAVFRHSGGHSVNKLCFAARQLYWYTNQLRYFSRHHSGVEVSCLRTAIAAGMLLRSLLACFGFCRGGTSLRQMIDAYWRVGWRCAGLGQGLPTKSTSPHGPA